MIEWWSNTTGVIQIIDTVVYDDYEYPAIDDFNNILRLDFYHEFEHTYVNLYNCITIILGLNLCSWSLMKTNPHPINFCGHFWKDLLS